MSKVFNMVGGGGGGGGKNISSIVITGLSSTDTVTCTKDGKTYHAAWDETAQHWEIIGLPLGTFTVTATNGTETKTETVLIDVDGVYDITLYLTKLYLYSLGDEFEDVTGGWGNYSDTSQKNISALVKNNDNLYSACETCFSLAGTENLINLTDYKTLYVDVKPGTGQNEHGWVGASVVTQKEWLELKDNPPAFLLWQQGTNGADRTVYSIDVSNLTGSYYITILTYCKSFNIYNVWLEE